MTGFLPLAHVILGAEGRTSLCSPLRLTMAAQGWPQQVTLLAPRLLLGLSTLVTVRREGGQWLPSWGWVLDLTPATPPERPHPAYPRLHFFLGEYGRACTRNDVMRAGGLKKGEEAPQSVPDCWLPRLHHRTSVLGPETELLHGPVAMLVLVLVHRVEPEDHRIAGLVWTLFRTPNAL